LNRLVLWQYFPFVLAAVVCGPVTTFAADAPQSRDCRLKQLASIDLKIDSTVLAPVVVNGTQSYMGLLTGSSGSSISQKAAAEMMLPLHPPPAIFAKGSATVGIASIDSFSLGSFPLGEISFRVNSNLDLKAGENMPEFIGWFGMQSLFGMDFEFDFAHNKLNLFSIDHCDGKVVYWTDTATSVPYALDALGTVVFPMELDGKRIEATVQASIAHTRLKTDVSKKVYGFDENSAGIKSENTEAGKPQSHYLAMKMTAKGLSVTNADVYLVAGNKACVVSSNVGPEHAVGYANCSGNPPLLLGLDILRHLRLYFATKEHVLYFTAADAASDVAPATK
jgi:hypothetical protein